MIGVRIADSDQDIPRAINSIPPGKWAVGVSGGADSVALLALLRTRADLSLRVVHLDHQTRDGASADDAQFVRQLAMQWNLDCDVSQLKWVLPAVAHLPKNRSARFRAARLAWFGRVVVQHQLDGAILGHHALDQAETILLRLLRGSGYTGLTGMSARTTLGGMVVLRPMLNVAPGRLREHLRGIGQTWREDASNESPDYARNRVRRVLKQSPSLAESVMELGRSCAMLHGWSRGVSAPPQRLPVKMLQELPQILAREMARRWLGERGASRSELHPPVLDRLIQMACDLATSGRQQFPGGITVKRRRGEIVVE